MNPLKAETAVSEVFKYDHVQVDVIKHYMEISDSLLFQSYLPN